MDQDIRHRLITVFHLTVLRRSGPMLSSWALSKKRIATQWWRKCAYAIFTLERVNPVVSGRCLNRENQTLPGQAVSGAMFGLALL